MNWRELMRIQSPESHGQNGQKHDSKRYELAAIKRHSEPQKVLTKLTEPRPPLTFVNVVNQNQGSPPANDAQMAIGPKAVQGVEARWNLPHRRTWLVGSRSRKRRTQTPS
jgi:hypothetical protein